MGKLDVRNVSSLFTISDISNGNVVCVCVGVSGMQLDKMVCTKVPAGIEHARL